MRESAECANGKARKQRHESTSRKMYVSSRPSEHACLHPKNTMACISASRAHHQRIIGMPQANNSSAPSRNSIWSRVSSLITERISSIFTLLRPAVVHSLYDCSAIFCRNSSCSVQPQQIKVKTRVRIQRINNTKQNNNELPNSPSLCTWPQRRPAAHRRSIPSDKMTTTQAANHQLFAADLSAHENASTWEMALTSSLSFMMRLTLLLGICRPC